MKKILAILLATMMIVGLGLTAFADDAPKKGTITIENATKNQEYKAYKIFNAYVDETDSTKVNYTVSSAGKAIIDADSSAPFVVGLASSDGGYNVTLKEGATPETILTWINSNATSFDTTGKTGTFNEAGSTVTWTDMDFGYYYITSGLGAAVTIDTLAPNVKFQDKNYNKATDPDKNITKIDDVAWTGDGKFSDQAQVGSVITFEVKFNAVNWAVEDGLTSNTLEVDKTVTPVPQTKYELVDDPENMTIQETPISVTIDGVAGEVTFDKNTNTFTIPWATDLDNDGKWVEGTSKFKYAPAEGKQTMEVVLTYTATIDQAAAEEGAENSVNDGPPVVFEFYKFKLDKVDGSYKDLTGAKFQLKDADNNIVKFSMDGADYVSDKNGTIDTIDLSEVANAVIKGLKKGAYTVVETQAPGGYNAAADKSVAEDVLKKHDEDITDVPNAIEGDDGVVTVVNEKGVELPSTGGIGTTIFYIVGGLLAVGAGVVLVTKKRMGKEEI